MNSQRYPSTPILSYGRENYGVQKLHHTKNCCGQPQISPLRMPTGPKLSTCCANAPYIFLFQVLRLTEAHFLQMYLPGQANIRRIYRS